MGKSGSNLWPINSTTSFDVEEDYVGSAAFGLLTALIGLYSI